MRVVLDTDVVVAGFRSPTGASPALLEAALQRTLIVVASVPLLFEYEAVLKRDSQVKAPGLTDAELERALQLLTKACDKQALHFFCGDPSCMTWLMRWCLRRPSTPAWICW